MNMKQCVDAKIDRLTDLRYPLLATPELDGIRCQFRNGEGIDQKAQADP